MKMGFSRIIRLKYAGKSEFSTLFRSKIFPGRDKIITQSGLEDQIDTYGRMMIALGIIESCLAFAALIPEVRSNMMSASVAATSTNDVLAIDGRITLVPGMPRGEGKPRFGASSHKARLIFKLRKVNPAIPAGVDFANTPQFAVWLAEYCRKKGWAFAMIDRVHELAAKFA